MAFDLDNWTRVSATANEPIYELQNDAYVGGPRIYAYYSPTDTQATIEGSGYFGSSTTTPGVSGDLVTGDIILSYSATDGTWVWLSVTNSQSYSTPFGGLITTATFSSAAPVGTANITNNAVTYAKFQQVAADSLVGNPTGSLANAEGITLGNGLSFSGTTLQVNTTLANYATGTLTSANLEAMYGTPISLITAPGSGFAIVVDKFCLEYVHVTTAYATNAGSAYLTYGSSAHAAADLATAAIALTGLTDQTVSTISAAGGALVGLADTAVNNAAIYISNTSAALATGDGTAVWNIWYRIVAL